MPLLLAMRGELIRAGHFRFARRRYGFRISWPRGARLADVLALYDLGELVREAAIASRST